VNPSTGRLSWSSVSQSIDRRKSDPDFLGAIGASFHSLHRVFAHPRMSVILPADRLSLADAVLCFGPRADRGRVTYQQHSEISNPLGQLLPTMGVLAHDNLLVLVLRRENGLSDATPTFALESQQCQCCVLVSRRDPAIGAPVGSGSNNAAGNGAKDRIECPFTRSMGAVATVGTQPRFFSAA